MQNDARCFLHYFETLLKTLWSFVLPTRCNQSINSPKPVDEELFCDVVFAVGVLKGQIELVVLVEHAEAVLCVGSRTPLCAARAVDVHFYVLLELLRVLEAAVAGATIGNKPGHT